MLVVVLLLLIPLFVYLGYWVIRTRNPYITTLYIGKKGSGKSTLITKLCLKYHNSYCRYYDDVEHKWKKERWRIYVNTDVTLPFYVRRYKIEDLGKFVPVPNSVVIADEINLIWDNRDFKNFSKDCQEYFRLSRKLRNRVILFSQSFDADRKIRTLCDELWLLSGIGGIFSYGKRITKVIDIKDNALNADSQVVDTLKFASILAPHSRQFTFIPKYIKYFKSYENLANKPYIKWRKTETYTPTPFLKVLSQRMKALTSKSVEQDVTSNTRQGVEEFVLSPTASKSDVACESREPVNRQMISITQ